MFIRPTRLTPFQRFILILGDAATFLLFTLLGQLEHRITPTTPGLLTTALPLFTSWLAISIIVGNFSRQAFTSTGTVLLRTLIAWIIAGPIGLILRHVYLQAPTFPFPFAAVTLGVVFVLLCIWRFLFRLFVRQ